MCKTNTLQTTDDGVTDADTDAVSKLIYTQRMSDVSNVNTHTPSTHYCDKVYIKVFC